MNKKSFKLFCLIPAILLIIAPILPLPYSFYIFLRYVITISSLLVIYRLYSQAFLIIELETTIGMIVIAILYNPIFPIHLSREMWLPINFITSGLYFWYYNQRKEDFENN